MTFGWVQSSYPCDALGLYLGASVWTEGGSTNGTLALAGRLTKYRLYWSRHLFWNENNPKA